MREIPVRAVIERIDRRCRAIVKPSRMHMEWNYHQQAYYLQTPDEPTKDIGPIVPRDLLPLLRYLGGFKPSDRVLQWGIITRDGTVIPEGKLRNSLHIKFTSAALQQLRILLKDGETVQEPMDTSVVETATPVDHGLPDGLTLEDVEIGVA